MLVTGLIVWVIIFCQKNVKLRQNASIYFNMIYFYTFKCHNLNKNVFADRAKVWEQTKKNHKVRQLLKRFK